MGRVVVTEFVSLDGVMEAPGGDDDFVRGQWSFEFDRGDEGNEFKGAETMESDGLLLGRKTYEGFANAWPGRDGEFADKFNEMPKYRVSTTLKDPEWGNTTVLDSGDDAVLVHRCDWERTAVVAVHNLSPTPRELRIDLGPMDGCDQVIDLLDQAQPALDVDGSSLEVKLAGYAHKWFRLQRSEAATPA